MRSTAPCGSSISRPSPSAMASSVRLNSGLELFGSNVLAMFEMAVTRSAIARLSGLGIENS